LSKLADQSEHALNETRMLILGAHVLLGFGFQGAFQPGFEHLPPPAQELKLLGLGLMLLAVGLLLAPGAFHQITECGNDTPRLIDYTGRIASLALLPFALGIGIEVGVATLIVFDTPVAPIVGVLGTAFALFFWYGLDWLWRERDRQRGIERTRTAMPEPTSLETRIKQVLTEARVVLPGVQALLGFQLAAMLTDAFGRLPRSSQYVHLTSLVLLAMSIVFLMAPAAFHRIVERGEDTERLHSFSSAMVLIALVPLAFGLAGDFYVVVDKVLQSSTAAIGLAVATLVLFFGLWFGVTLALRARSDASQSKLQVSRAVR
jgi:uncharacterized protein DUF6328